VSVYTTSVKTSTTTGPIIIIFTILFFKETAKDQILSRNILKTFYCSFTPAYHLYQMFELLFLFLRALLALQSDEWVCAIEHEITTMRYVSSGISQVVTVKCYSERERWKSGYCDWQMNLKTTTRPLIKIQQVI